MRNHKSFVWMFLFLVVQTRLASGNEGGPIQREPLPESVATTQKWSGTVQCQQYSHTSNHLCDLELVETSSGERIEIVENPDLLKRHCQSDRNLLVNLVGEKTPRFLFWGGGIKVASFEVIRELGAMPKSALHSERPRVRSRGGQ